jgi:ubiquinone/menaquinone biosynthesis C-methylase UbiE
MRFVGITGRVHGVDVDATTISRLNALVEKLGLQNIDAAIGDATKRLPLPEASIDTCIIANVLHGFAVNKEVDLVFTELRRVMKPWGKIAIVEFKKKKRLPGPPFEDRLSPADVDEILATRGCSKVAAFNTGVLHYARVFKIG